jgi:hypothetical protein
MAARLAIVPEVELDLAEAYSWYEKRRPGLGEEFLSSVDACLESILRHPEMHTFVHETYRRALIRRFPFAIFYDYAGGEVNGLRGVSHLQRPAEMAPAPPLVDLFDETLASIIHVRNSK